MIGQGHCILCGVEVLAQEESGEDSLHVTIEARGNGSRIEWTGEAHPDCVRDLWGQLATGSVVPDGED